MRRGFIDRLFSKMDHQGRRGGDAAPAGKEDVPETAMRRIITRQFLAACAFAATGTVCWITTGRFAFAAVPYIAVLYPLAMAARIRYLFRNKRIHTVPAVCRGSRADPVAGLLSGFTSRRIYYFDYEIKGGRAGTFIKHGGGRLSGPENGRTYLVLFTGDGGPDEMNLIEVIKIPDTDASV